MLYLMLISAMRIRDQKINIFLKINSFQFGLYDELKGI